MKTPSERAADSIIQDLSDRRGLKHEWHNIREDIQDEIRAEWSALIERHTLAGEMERLLTESADKIDEALSPTVWGTLSSRFETAVASELKAVATQTRALLAKLQSK